MAEGDVSTRSKTARRPDRAMSSLHPNTDHRVRSLYLQLGIDTSSLSDHESAGRKAKGIAPLSFLRRNARRSASLIAP
jgi:hypothetical protein